MYKIDRGRIVRRRYKLDISAYSKSIDWKTIDPQLGLISDRKLASIYKIDRVAISERRMALGISAYSKDQEQDWTSIDPLLIAGTSSIIDISRKFNVPESSLYHRCKKLGVIHEKHEPPCWSKIDPLLGTVSDIELAQEFDISTRVIYARRKKLEIPPYKSRNNIDWSTIDA
jgi:hypothetical protein